LIDILRVQLQDGCVLWELDNAMA